MDPAWPLEERLLQFWKITNKRTAQLKSQLFLKNTFLEVICGESNDLSSAINLSLSLTSGVEIQ
jgi:hypothetical protein